MEVPVQVRRPKSQECEGQEKTEVLAQSNQAGTNASFLYLCSIQALRGLDGAHLQGREKLIESTSSNANLIIDTVRNNFVSKNLSLPLISNPATF